MPLAALAALSLVLAVPPASGPTIAVEDTMHTELPPVLVHAPRVTLAEILQRVARGEARRESLLTDETFVATTRLVRNPKNARDTAQVISETLTRVTRKKPGKLRNEILRHWEAYPEKNDKDGMGIEFREGMGERIVNFAFRPEAWREFRYTIVGRDLVGDHLVYRIAFEPRSLLSVEAPSGLVWVDTNDFVIVRQELGFKRSPFPLLIKDLNRMVVERERVGAFWVLRRVLMRIEFTVPLPKVGRSFDVSVLFDKYALNRGLDDALFKGAASPREDETP
jgi:hypothetical protein